MTETADDDGAAELALGWRALARPDRLPAAAILLCGILLHSMNVLVMATTLPSVVADIGGAAQISWPTTSYVAASIVAAAVTGTLVAVVGAKQAFMAGALVFAAGTAGCALAIDIYVFIAGRFVQGFGGGLLTATAYILVRNVFPKALWPRVFALLASVWSVSVLLGPLVGGVFASAGNWRGAFFTLAAIACVVALFTLKAFPATRRPEGPPPRAPGLRIALVCMAIAAISAASIAPALAGRLGLLVVGAALVAVMLRIDRAAPRRMLPQDAFSMNTATGVGLWTALLMLSAFAPTQLFAPIFLQALHGLDPLAAGYVVAAASLAWTVAAIGVAGLGGAWQGRIIVAGPLIILAGLGATALTLPDGPLALIPLAVALIGGGIGMAWAFTAQRVMGHALPGDEDAAAGSVATVQQAGTALGAAVAGIAANAAGFARSAGAGADAAAASDAVLAVLGVSAAMACLAALAARRLRRLTA